MADNFFEALKTKFGKAFSTQDKQSDYKKEELDSLKSIMDELDHLPTEEARYLAVFSFILFRVAYADSHVSEEELNKIESLIVGFGGLSKSQAALVAKMAKSQNILFGGTDNFLVVREFKQMATQEQSYQLLECLFAVAASDDSISSLESDTIRMTSKELGIEHQEFIAIRSGFRDKLEALK